MHLLPDSLMYGVAPALLIDCAVQIHGWDQDGEGYPFTLEEFSEALGAPIEESEVVLRAMLADGVFEHFEGCADQFLATKKLGQLALASISSGVSREEAGVLLDQIIEKIAWVNARPDEFGHRIVCVVVFGSYITDKSRLGDLDVAAELEELRSHTGRRENEGLYKWLDRIRSARTRTLNALRLRRPNKISVHELEEVIRLRTPYKTVFGALPETYS